MRTDGPAKSEAGERRIRCVSPLGEIRELAWAWWDYVWLSREFRWRKRLRSLRRSLGSLRGGIRREQHP